MGADDILDRNGYLKGLVLVVVDAEGRFVSRLHRVRPEDLERPDVRMPQSVEAAMTLTDQDRLVGNAFETDVQIAPAALPAGAKQIEMKGSRT